uniref:Uncharacterized protein n=1 Tax=Oryza rufipogon TaxID=4529 RepID=A0A0E0Q7P4_ORYRU
MAMPSVGIAALSSTSIATPPRPRRQGPVVDVLSSAGITTSPLSRWSCLVPPLQGALTIREEIELMRNVYKLLGGLHGFSRESSRVTPMATPAAAAAKEVDKKVQLMKEIRAHEVAIGELNNLPPSRIQTILYQCYIKFILYMHSKELIIFRFEGDKAESVTEEEEVVASGPWGLRAEGRD